MPDRPRRLTERAPELWELRFLLGPARPTTAPANPDDALYDIAWAREADDRHRWNRMVRDTLSYYLRYDYPWRPFPTE